MNILLQRIIHAIKMAERPLTVDELMPLCLCESHGENNYHSVIQSTGRIIYDREKFCKTMQEGLKAGILEWKANQINGTIAYVEKGHPSSAESSS